MPAEFIGMVRHPITQVCDGLADLIHHLESIRYILKVFLKWKNHFRRSVISRAHALGLKEEEEQIDSNYIFGLVQHSCFFGCCKIHLYFEEFCKLYYFNRQNFTLSSIYPARWSIIVDLFLLFTYYIITWEVFNPRAFRIMISLRAKVNP